MRSSSRSSVGMCSQARRWQAGRRSSRSHMTAVAPAVFGNVLSSVLSCLLASAALLSYNKEIGSQISIVTEANDTARMM